MPYRVGRQSQASIFEQALLNLSVEQKFLLQVIHDLRRVSHADLSRHYATDAAQLRCSLELLEFRTLVVSAEDYWYPTWTGDGAANWREHLAAASGMEPTTIPAPRHGENGQILGPPCQEYRSAFFAPGYCWCCRLQSDHVGEFLKAAQTYLRRSKP